MSLASKHKSIQNRLAASMGLLTLQRVCQSERRHWQHGRVTACFHNRVPWLPQRGKVTLIALYNDEDYYHYRSDW